MQCKNCGQETDGIKINGKLFCTNCGEALEVNKIEEPKISEIPEPPRAKIISQNDESPELKEEEVELDILEAENLALDQILKETLLEQKNISSKITNTRNTKIKLKEETKHHPIIKHERARADKIHGLDLMDNQPNPIDEPELPIPHDDMIEESKVTLATPKDEVTINFADTNEDQRFPLLTNESKENITLKQKQKSTALKSFFAKGLVESSKNKKTSSKKTPKKHKGIYLTLIVIFFIIFCFILFVLYVNFYAINPDRAVKKAEENISFEYTKPKYIPPGYEINYQTNAKDDKITYIYEYLPDKSKTLTILIEKSNISNEKIFDDFVLESNMEYSEKTFHGIIFWIIGDTKAIFKDKALYQIGSSDTISTEELTKIVEGII